MSFVEDSLHPCFGFVAHEVGVGYPPNWEGTCADTCRVRSSPGIRNGRDPRLASTKNGWASRWPFPLTNGIRIRPSRLS